MLIYLSKNNCDQEAQVLFCFFSNCDRKRFIASSTIIPPLALIHELHHKNEPNSTCPRNLRFLLALFLKFSFLLLRHLDKSRVNRNRLLWFIFTALVTAVTDVMPLYHQWQDAGWWLSYSHVRLKSLQTDGVPSPSMLNTTHRYRGISSPKS